MPKWLLSHYEMMKDSSHPLKKVKSIIIDSYAGMQDKVIDVNFKIKMDSIKTKSDKIILYNSRLVGKNWNI